MPLNPLKKVACEEVKGFTPKSLHRRRGRISNSVFRAGSRSSIKRARAARRGSALSSRPRSRRTHTRLRYQCSPYHRDSVLHPFVVQLGRAARLAPEDPPETQLEKLEAILAPARIAETAPLFASLLSIPTGDRYPPLALSAAQQRRLTLAALLDQLEALGAAKAGVDAVRRRPLGRPDLARSARSDGRAGPRLAGIGDLHLPAG